MEGHAVVICVTCDRFLKAVDSKPNYLDTLMTEHTKKYI